ncbi:NAD(P)H-dependent FMN reductase [Abditibacterium utsteinense]|uniref:NAD(P)H-dependent FMN reductase n=1 Tax=Abditibacterium utsteinense TaxID=1960156 RepID=A0A2S8SU07_9BACT|nr:NADPH-dependent FMN reductase [Abditibacterium utsteinense]PQV64270.1 NAD(P)H-dependent FMN reductase [Abditibacterium utsteinense]
MLQILAISGSLRAQSSNTSILRATQKMMESEVEIALFETIGDLPHFNPDLDTETPPASVAEFRAQLENADGILICTPEYAHGLPGSFKNALDWTVSSGQWMEKPTLILKSSRSHFAHDSLVEILTTIMAKISVCEVFLSGNKMDEAAMLRDEIIAVTLRAALDDFAAQFHKK